MSTLNYSIQIASTYNQTASPIIFNVGYYNTKISGYKCISLIPSSTYMIYPFNNDLQQIQNNILQAGHKGSYTVQFLDMNYPDNESIIYSFYIFEKPFIINQDILLRVINRELPEIYNPTNQLNHVDNYASSGIINEVYNYIYELFYNSMTSIGATILGDDINSGAGYNPNWETVYIGVTNFLQNATYPAAFLKTLMTINTKCSVQKFSISITLSRLCYQFLGITVPVYIEYNDDIKKSYTINIYYTENGAWVLGDSILSVLGSTTTLVNENSKDFLWIIQTIANRLMPAFVNFKISYHPITLFNSSFNISDVSSGVDFIDTSVIYDAYIVINNNNVFNTQGYFLNP